MFVHAWLAWSRLAGVVVVDAPDRDALWSGIAPVPDGSLVYLDALSPVEEDDDPLGCLDTSPGAVPLTDRVLLYHRDDVHLVVEIWPRSRDRFPFNDATCEYVLGISLRGCGVSTSCNPV